MILKIPKYGEHAIFLGMTGCGKSTLAEECLKRYNRYFLFDTQNGLSLSGKKVKKPSETVREIKKKTDRIHYVPPIAFHERDINNYILGELLDSSSKRKKNPFIIYIDEIFQLGYMQSFPKNIPIAFAVARQRGISMFVSTQRPKLIPSNLMTEASHFYIFKLKKEDDIKYVSSFISKKTDDFYLTLKNLNLDEHKFIYVNARSGDWILCDPIKFTEMEDKRWKIWQR